MAKRGIKEYLYVFLLAVFAGLAIAFGGALFELCLKSLPTGGRLVGSLAFSVGLLLVCFCGFNLYTGKIGYALKAERNFLNDLPIILLGNAVGAVAFGYLLALTPLGGSLADTAATVSNGKLIDLGNGGQSWYSMTINSFFCGVLVFLAVDIFKKAPSYPVKALGIIICVFAFVALGFEHCVADMFYFAFSNAWGQDFGRAILSMVIYIIGNSLGSLSFRAVFMLGENIKAKAAVR